MKMGYSGTFCIKNGSIQEGWPCIGGRNIIHSCLDLHCQVAFPEGQVSHQGGLSKGFHFICSSKAMQFTTKLRLV